MPAHRPSGDIAELNTFLAINDAPCEGCGYNLRGVVGGLCPECGRQNSLPALTLPPPPPSVACLIALPVFFLIFGAMTWGLAIEAWEASTVTTATAQGSRGGVRVVASGSPALRNVPWTTWLGVGFYSTLALAGAAGSLVMYRARFSLSAAKWQRLRALSLFLLCAFCIVQLVVSIGRYLQ